MTISTQSARAQYAGNGVTTSFSVPFEFLTSSPPKVIYTIAGVDTPWVLTTNYTLTGGGAQQPATGSIVAVIAPPLGSIVTILRNEPLTQSADYIPDDPFPATAHEKALDRLSMQNQMLAERLGRSISFNESSTASGIKIADPVAGKLIGWNDDATALANKEIIATPGYVAGSIGLQILLSDVPATVRDLLKTPVYVVDRTALKAIDTAKDKAAVLMESGLEGVFIWKAGNFSTQVTADTAEGIYVKATAIAASAGAWVRMYSGNANARWFGTGQAAIIAAQVMADDVDVSDAYSFTSTVTLPRGKRLFFRDGGLFNIATGVTLTIRGQVMFGIWRGIVVAGANKIFNCTGTGQVLGVMEVWPELWGAVGDGVTDDKPALQAAHDCVEGSMGSDGARPTITLRGGANYGLDSQFQVRPTSNINLKMTGSGPIFTGSRFTALATFSIAAGTGAVRIAGQTTSQSIASFEIGGFGVIAAVGTAATTGIDIGGRSAAEMLIGVQQSIIYDVYTSEFAIGWQIGNCRLISFERCSGWVQTNAANTTGMTITTFGNFTGDLDFKACQWVADGAGSARKCVFIYNPNTGTEIKGLRFHESIFYHADHFVDLYAVGGGAIGDVWFNPGCQFDGFGNRPISIQSDGATSVIDSVHIQNVYIRGINAGGVGVYAQSISSGQIRDIHVNANQIFSLLSGARAIIFEGVKGGTINDNIVTDLNFAAGQAILVNTSTRFTVNDNVLNAQGAGVNAAAFITLGAGCNIFSALGNIGFGLATLTVQDLSGGANKAVANNV